LVSVRSADEAEAALAGGAALIDVKEPSQGPLGRAPADALAAVLDAVAGRAPVSAALGELRDGLPAELQLGLRYCKAGLAGLARRDWRAALTRASAWALTWGGCELVVAAYADWRLAEAPPLEEVCAHARRRPGGVLLLDTWLKEFGPDRSRRTLL